MMVPVVMAGEVLLLVVSTEGGTQESVCRSYGEREKQGVRRERKLDSCSVREVGTAHSYGIHFFFSGDSRRQGWEHQGMAGWGR